MAAECERALSITLDPVHRENLTNIRELWISLAHERRFLSEGESSLELLPLLLPVVFAIALALMFRRLTHRSWIKQAQAQYRRFVYHSDVIELRGTVTGTRVDEDGDPAAAVVGRAADPEVDLLVVGVLAVREVEPHGVDAGVDQLPQPLVGRGCGPDRGDDLRPAAVG